MKNSSFSRLLTLCLSFSFVGALIAALLGPRMITWYAEPAVDMGFNCAPTVAWANSALLKWQMWGAVAGILLGFSALFFLSKRKKSH
ncbi:hypothetical protein GW915_09580 [bacterium]|nr:hypothetical protein [bacterium]